MFASRHSGTVIAKGLKIVGIVAAEGLVEVNGQIEGELRCSSLVIARGAHVTGTIAAERVVVDGKVEGPIHGGEVLLKSQAGRATFVFPLIQVGHRRRLRVRVGEPAPHGVGEVTATGVEKPPASVERICQSLAPDPI